MRRAVGADQPGAVHHETHGQLLYGDIMHDLVIRPLQKCRIYGDKRLVALRGKAFRKRDAMLFGDSDVERPFRERLLVVVARIGAAPAEPAKRALPRHCVRGGGSARSIPLPQGCVVASQPREMIQIRDPRNCFNFASVWRLGA